MSNVFRKPYLAGAVDAYFPYTREKLLERPIFPTYVYDGGAFLFINDAFDAANSDRLLELILSGELFDYWRKDGKFDWSAIEKKWKELQTGTEHEAHYWINRMYFLLPIAQQYCRTKDPKYARLWYSLLMDWADKNPYQPEGTVVWRDMQVAWRTINIVHSIFLLDGCDVLTAAQWGRVYDLIRLQADHLYKESLAHLSAGRTGNHKLQIAMADIMLGCLLPELGHSEEYLQAGRSMVADNLRITIGADGVCVENSLSYAHFSARLFLEASLLLRLNGKEPVEGLDEGIRKQYEYLYQFSSPAGKTLQVGDSYAMDALADIKFVDSVFPLNFPRRKKSVLFPNGQLAVLRNSRFDVYIDAMKPPVKGNGYTWHPHYGKPTFLVYADGRPLVIDRGCPNYNRSDLYIPLYIESGHNVVTCDEMPLAKTASLFPTDVKADYEITSFDADPESPSLTVRGTFADPEGRRYVWDRSFRLFEDRLEITDTVEASEKLHFTSYLYIPSHLNLTCAMRPLMPSQQMICDSGCLTIRMDEMKESITTGTPFIFECRPCVNDRNRIDYCGALTRSWFTDRFTERTVLKLETPAVFPRG